MRPIPRALASFLLLAVGSARAQVDAPAPAAVVTDPVAAPVLTEPTAGLGLLPAAGDAALPGAIRAGAVYQLHPRADAITIGAAAIAISAPSLLAEEIIQRRCPCDPATVNRFDRMAIGRHSSVADAVSNVTVLAAMAGPPILAATGLEASDAFYSDVTVFAETLLVNGAFVEAAKYIAQRPLPLTYAGDPTLLRTSGGYRSFYSGHTSTAFAALMSTAYTVRLRHGEHVWPWIAAAGIGASVGVERVLAGRHFPSDVIVGALAGTAVGIGVPWFHSSAPGLTVVPSRNGVGVAFAF